MGLTEERDRGQLLGCASQRCSNNQATMFAGIKGGSSAGARDGSES